MSNRIDLLNERIVSMLQQGLKHHRENRVSEAENIYRGILDIDPGNANALQLIGVLCAQRGNHRQAVEYYDRAIESDPNFAGTYNNRGISLSGIGNHTLAIESFKHALALDPHASDVFSNLGNTLSKLGRFVEAKQYYLESLRLDPDQPGVRYNIGRASRIQCDWAHYEESRKLIEAWDPATQPAPTPFTMLMWLDSPEKQQLCSRAYSKANIEAVTALDSVPAYDGKHVRIAYLSADFREHPVAYLSAELFELHDRSHFEVTAFAYGKSGTSPTRKRLEKAFDHFIEVSHLNDQEIAALIASKEIHILIDLTGHTLGGRPGILARRPAPIQISYIGFIGTMGCDFIDYILVDEQAVPPDQQCFFDETLVYLPCYMVNDSRRAISPRTPTRAECGLPDEGFVFCCFNNSYKLTPDLFDIWMRILDRVAGSVLWLVGNNDEMKDNLREEARARGIDSARIVFADKTSYPDHLARQQLADLFLDTSPYNAGATASDALWSGVPVLTCPGRSFVSRMGGSLLRAVGLPELIVNSMTQYEKKAVELAGNSQLLASYHQRLIDNRYTAPLFDSRAFCRYLEEALIDIFLSWKSGNSDKFN